MCVAVDFNLFVNFNIVDFIVNFVYLLLIHICNQLKLFVPFFQVLMFVHLRFHLPALWGRFTT